MIKSGSRAEIAGFTTMEDPGNARLEALQRVEELMVAKDYEVRRLEVWKLRERANRDVVNELRFGSAGDRLRAQNETWAMVSEDLMLDLSPQQSEGMILREQTDLRAKITEAQNRIQEIDVAIKTANAAFVAANTR